MVGAELVLAIEDGGLKIAVRTARLGACVRFTTSPESFCTSLASFLEVPIQV